LGFLVCGLVLSASCHGGTRFRATSGGVLDLLVGEENDYDEKSMMVIVASVIDTSSHEATNA